MYQILNRFLLILHLFNECTIELMSFNAVSLYVKFEINTKKTESWSASNISLEKSLKRKKNSHQWSKINWQFVLNHLIAMPPKCEKSRHCQKLMKRWKKKRYKSKNMYWFLYRSKMIKNHMFLLCSCCFSKNKKISKKCWIINIKNIIHTINEKNDIKFQIWFMFQIKCNWNTAKNIKMYDCQFFRT